MNSVNRNFKVVRTPSPEPPPRETISIGELTRQCNAAASKMGVANPHKLLLLNCASAMQQLFHRIDELEKPRIELT